MRYPYINKALLAISLVLLVVSLFFALKLPIYPDEIAYKIFLERVFINGGYRQSLTPYCLSNFLTKPPLLLLPASIVWSFISDLGISYLSYRILPITALIGIFSIIYFDSTREYKSRVVFSFLLITITPAIYGLIILRPEIFILLFGLLIYIICKLLIKKDLINYRNIYTLLIIFIYSLIIYLHPKVIYLYPLIFFGLLFSSEKIKNLYIKLFYVIFYNSLIIAIIYSAVIMHKRIFLSCPEVPYIQQIMNIQAINLLEIFKDFDGFIDAFTKTYSHENLLRIASQLSFYKNFDIQYLPKIDVISPFIKFTNIVNIEVLFSSCLAIILALFYYVRKKSQNLKSIVLIVMLALGYLMPTILSISKNWYDISFFVGAVMIIFSLSIPYIIKLEQDRKIYKIFTFYLIYFLLLIGSVSTLSGIYLYINPKLNLGYAGPGISLQVNRDSVGQTISRMLQEGQVPKDSSMIVDDFTYDHLKMGKYVAPITYLGLAKNSPEDVNFSLEMLKINYGLTRCDNANSVKDLFRWQIITESADELSHEKLCLFIVNYKK